jgi:hypothetical protein
VKTKRKRSKNCKAKRIKGKSVKKLRKILRLSSNLSSLWLTHFEVKQEMEVKQKIIASETKKKTLFLFRFGRKRKF